MITLSNGRAFKYVVASGALAFDGKGWPWERPLVWLGLIKPELFAVVIKTLTRNPRPGNLRWWKPWTCLRLIHGGSVNKIGLTNRGVEWWCREIGPKLDFQKFSIVGSIFGDTRELVVMAKMLNRFDLVALEVNVSCPNTGHTLEQAQTVIDSVKVVKSASRHPIIIKVPLIKTIAPLHVDWSESRKRFRSTVCRGRQSLRTASGHHSGSLKSRSVVGAEVSPASRRKSTTGKRSKLSPRKDRSQ